MKDDHVATLPLVHWPRAGRLLVSRPAAGRRLLAGPRPLGHAQRLLPPDRPPFETFRPEPDAYVTPYLAQAVGPARPGADLAPGAAPPPPRAGSTPSSPRPRAGAGHPRPPAGSLGRAAADAEPPLAADLEPSIETGRLAEAAAGARRAWSRSGPGALARGIVAARQAHGAAGPATSCSTRWASPGARPCSCPTPRSTSAPRGRSAPPSSPTRGSGPSSTCPPSATPGCPREAEPRAPPPTPRRALGPRPHAPERVDRGRDRRGDRRHPRRDGRRRGDGPARPAARHRGPGRVPTASRSPAR